ncbi:MAG: heme ABC exporter ATP-binding protein CcmA [Paracoccaceae bacterium]
MNLTGQSLACKRGENLILSGIDFSINTGEFCFVKGPNGSGKSSFLRLLAGFLKVEIGSLYLNKENITDNREARVDNFLYLGHQNVLKSHLTVIEQITFWELASNKLYDFSCDPMNIKIILKKKIHECSEGQRRRVALARLVIEKNKNIWLLDEPTVSLDENNVKIFKGILIEHYKNGGLAFIATHDNLGMKPDLEINLGAKKYLPLKPDPFL